MLEKQDIIKGLRQIVLSPVMEDGAGGSERHAWNVVDPEGIFSSARQKSIE